MTKSITQLLIGETGEEKMDPQKSHYFRKFSRGVYFLKISPININI